MKHRPLIAGLIGVALVALSACGSSSDSENGGEASADGKLVYSYTLPATSLDPHVTASPFDLTYMRPVYDSLFTTSSEGVIEASLATEWAWVDDSTLELKLREGVTFHDGTPFDGEAVKANIERAKVVEGGSQVSALAPVSAVEVVDPTTVRLTVESSAAGAILGILAGQAGMMASPKAFDSLAQEPVGTGAFEIATFKPNTSVTYARYDDAWNPDEAAAASLEIINVADSTQRVNQLLSGEANMANIDPNQVEEIEGRGFQVESQAGADMFYVGLNFGRPALGTADARRAINLAIDREAIAESVLFGYAEASVQVLPSTSAGFNRDLDIAADLAEAKKLAESSGLTDTPLKFIVPGSPALKTQASAVQGMLKKAGIEATIQIVDNAQITTLWKKGGADLIMTYYPGSTEPWTTYNTFFNPDSLLNAGGEPPAAVSEGMAKLAAETDPEVRAALLEDLAQLVYDEGLIAVLNHPAIPVAGSADITGLNPYYAGSPDFRGTGVK